MNTNFLSAYLNIWILFVHMRDEIMHKEKQKKNQIVMKTNKKYGHPFWRLRCWWDAVVSWMVWTDMNAWISKEKFLYPVTECPITMQWILITILVSNYGCQIFNFCCEQHKCQCADSVAGVKTIATKSLKCLSQRKSSGFFLIKIILKVKISWPSRSLYFIEELSNVPAC